jgi:putative membrane protein
MIWAWLINSVSVFLTAKVLKGVEVKNFWSAVWVAAGISVVNFLLGPILQILALPITIITFGLFALVINAFLVMLVDQFIDGFKIKSFGWALAFTIILSFISSILRAVFI